MSGPAKEGRRTSAPIILKNHRSEWIAAILLFAILALFLVEYHRWRGKPWSLLTLNKGMAIAATLLLALSLSLGPVRRILGLPTSIHRLRRSLALTGAFFMILHLPLSIFFVDRFDPAYFGRYWLSWVFGGAAFLGFGFMAATSFPWALKRYGRAGWDRIHGPGILFLVLVAVHIIFLGKPAGWLRWLREGVEPVPPGTTIPTIAVLAVLMLRGTVRLRARRAARKTGSRVSANAETAEE